MGGRSLLIGSAVLALALALALLPAWATDDVDGDGVGDVEDNCVDVANPDQRDTDSDGYGNRCDADFDNDGDVGSWDSQFLLLVWGLTPGDPGYDPDADLNGDDAVGGPDFVILSNLWGEPPGPSGLACAGGVPCPTSITDIDTDGVEDGDDNCLWDWNPDQHDTNVDGFGNLCDTDFDDNGGVGITDHGLISIAYGTSVGDPAYDVDIDTECDGDIDQKDYDRMMLDWGQAPGPSGLSCAGQTVPCASSSRASMCFQCVAP